MSFSVIYVTNENEANAQLLADSLLQKKLIACANIFPIKSAYWWQGNIEHEDEYVAILKTSDALWAKVCEEIEQIHPYDVPCIMRIQAEANAAYEAWILNEVATP